MKASEARAGAAERRAAAQKLGSSRSMSGKRHCADKRSSSRRTCRLSRSGWQAVAEGKDPGQQVPGNVVRDPRAGSFNPERYLQQDYAEAGKTFVSPMLANLMRQAQEKENSTRPRRKGMQP